MSRNRRMLVYDPDPVINERIRRAVRYGQTRWAEVWLSLIAVSVGLVLVGPTETFSNESFRVISSVVSERAAGSMCLFFGAVRLAALWVNGRRGRETSFIRTLGCLGGFVFWLAIAVGFALAAPPITTGVAVYTILAFAELHASGRAASDMAAEDTFGFRARRRQNAVADPPNLIQQLDSWQGIFIGCCAALAALLVPLTGFLKTFLDYRVESKKAEKQLKPEVARDVAQAGGSGVLFDSMAVADLTAAIKELTGAIRADTASDEAQHATQFAQVLNRLTEVLDRHDDDHGPPPRRTR